MPRPPPLRRALGCDSIANSGGQLVCIGGGSAVNEDAASDAAAATGSPHRIRSFYKWILKPFSRAEEPRMWRSAEANNAVDAEEAAASDLNQPGIQERL